MYNRSAKNLITGIVILALVTRLAVAVLTISSIFLNDDKFIWDKHIALEAGTQERLLAERRHYQEKESVFGYEMGAIAASISMGKGFSWPEWMVFAEQPTSWMAPVYPFIMAGAFKAFGVFSAHAAIALEVFLTIISALTCILLYLLGKRLYNPQVGLLAAFLFAIYPMSINFAVRTLWDTSLFTCSLLLIILIFLRLASDSKTIMGAYLGILLGFTALVNPVIIGAYPFALAWLYLKADGNRSSVIKMTALILITASLIISPWLVRNYLIFGQFAFIKSNFGNELYLGTSDPIWREKTPGFSRDDVNSWPLTEEERQFFEHSNEPNRNRFLFQKAVDFIMEHPLRFDAQVITRFVQFWSVTGKLSTMRPGYSGEAKFYLGIYFIVVVLAIAGLLLSKPKAAAGQLILLFLLSLPLPYYFTIGTQYRYRFPIEPILIIFASNALYELSHAARKRSKREKNLSVIPRRLKLRWRTRVG